jgi:hypothetical protein
MPLILLAFPGCARACTYIPKYPSHSLYGSMCIAMLYRCEFQAPKVQPSILWPGPNGSHHQLTTPLPRSKPPLN